MYINNSISPTSFYERSINIHNNTIANFLKDLSKSTHENKQGITRKGPQGDKKQRLHQEDMVVKQGGRNCHLEIRHKMLQPSQTVCCSLLSRGTDGSISDSSGTSHMGVSLNTTQCDAVHIRKLVTFFEKLRKKAFKSGGSPGFLDTAE